MAGSPHRSVARELSKHHFQSFEDFLDHRVEAALESQNAQFVMMKEKDASQGIMSSYRYQFRIHSPQYETPAILPIEARATDKTHALKMTVSVEVFAEDTETGETFRSEHAGVYLCDIPLMLGSRRCPLASMTQAQLIAGGEDPNDPLGYFVADGTEHFLVSHERPLPNVGITSELPTGEIQLNVESTDMEALRNPVVTRMVLGADTGTGGVLTVSCLPLQDQVNLAVVMRAMGVESDREVSELIMGEDLGGAEGDPQVATLLRPTLLAAAQACPGTGSAGVAQAQLHVGYSTPYGQNELRSGRGEEGVRVRGVPQAMHVLQENLLAGYGSDTSSKLKQLGRHALYLLEMRLGRKSVVSRDSMVRKRLDVSGDMMANVFEESYAVGRRSAVAQMDVVFYAAPSMGIRVFGEQAVDQVMGEARTVLNDMFHASFRGDWGHHKRGPMAKYTQTKAVDESGVVITVPRNSYAGVVSLARRINNPLNRGLKLRGPRVINSGEWGLVCPVDSPDGENIGLTRNLALGAQVSQRTPTGPLLQLLQGMGPGLFRAAETVPVSESRGLYAVYVNGILVGYSPQPGELVGRGRQARTSGELPGSVSVLANHGNREVHFACSSGRVMRELRHTSGRLEVLDAAEIDASVVTGWDEAEHAAYADQDHVTHFEPPPANALSALASCVPFASTNQSPRNALGCVQTKHAASVYHTGFRFRMDDSAYYLNYPQDPIVRSKLLRDTGADAHPNGINAVTSIMCVGWGQEDSVVLSRDSVQRGLFGITYMTVNKYVGGDGMRLDVSRAPKEGAAVIPGETVLMGLEKEVEPGVYADRSDRADIHYGGKFVDRVLQYSGAGGVDVAKVRLRKIRDVKQGDKMASRVGQKGVCSLLLPACDLPYDRSGVGVDIIVNPHAFPTRMTCGQLFELPLAKEACLTCRKVDATPFRNVPKEPPGGGQSQLVDGTSGQVLLEPAHHGPTYYMRLKQMVDDKINHRGGFGKYSLETRQAKKGRKAGGGLKIGEMERDSLLSHGVVNFMHETWSKRSGKDHITVRLDSSGSVLGDEPNEADAQYSLQHPYQLRAARVGLNMNTAMIRHELAGMMVDMGIHGQERTDVRTAAPQVDSTSAAPDVDETGLVDAMRSAPEEVPSGDEPDGPTLQPEAPPAPPARKKRLRLGGWAPSTDFF